MRNSAGRSGVYCSMRGVLLGVICAAAWGQNPQAVNPLDQALQSIWRVQGEHPEQVPALRDKARALLDSAPANDPRSAGWAQQLAQIYQNAGLNLQSRIILEQALARTAALGEGDSSRISLLNYLANYWQQDGNLLKAASYLERVATAPPPPKNATATGALGFVSIRLGDFATYDGYSGSVTGTAVNAQLRLVSLYQRLGRPEAIAAIQEKLSADPPALARFYEARGQYGDAAAVYRSLAERADKPQAAANLWQQAAQSYSQAQRYGDAAAAIQQAIAAVQTSNPQASPDQTLWMRQSLAGYLQNAGQTAQADEVYGKLLEQSRNTPMEWQVLSSYSYYLADSNRGALGLTTLNDYLANHPGLDPGQKTSLLYAQSNVANRANDPAASAAYRKAAEALQGAAPRPGAAAPEVQAALNARHFDEAFDLAMHAIDATENSQRQQLDWQVTSWAAALAGNERESQAEFLLQHMMAIVESDPSNNPNRLINFLGNSLNQLIFQPRFSGEAPALIERYRQLLLDANGAGSGRMLEPLRRSLQFERNQSHWPEAIATGRELLEMQQSLSGNTSEPYLDDLTNVASVYEAAGDPSTALAMHRQTIKIADLVATPNNQWRRAQTRIDTAIELARAGEFDEAESLAKEAVAIQPNVQPQLDFVRSMKQNSTRVTPTGDDGEALLIHARPKQ